MPRIPFVFPNSGLDENTNYPNQPPDTSADLNNVRVYDAIKKRQRGGRRSGLSKWFFDPINGTNRIQALTKAVESTAAVLEVAVEIITTHASNADTPASRVTSLNPAGTEIFDYGESATVPFAVQDAAKSLAGDYYLIGLRTGGSSEDIWKINSAEALQWTQDLGLSNVGKVHYDEANNRIIAIGTRNSDWLGAGGTVANVWALNSTTGAIDWTFDTGVGFGGGGPLTIGADGSIYVLNQRSDAWAGAGGTFATVWRLRGSDGAVLNTYDMGNISGIPDGIDIGPTNEIMVSDSSPTNTTWVGTDGSARNIWILSPSLTTPSVANTFLVEDFDNIGAFFDSKGNIVAPLFSNGLAALKSFTRAGVTRWEIPNLGGASSTLEINTSRDGKVYIAGAQSVAWRGVSTFVSANTSIYALDEDTGEVVWNSNAPGATVISVSIFNGIAQKIATRDTSLAAVAGGDITLIRDGLFATVTLGASILTTGLFQVQAVNAFSKVFYVDGVDAKYLDLADDTVKDWSDDVTAGSLPALTRLVTRYRGRMVVAGSVLDPHNWFMSRLGDPFDFNTAPANPTAIDAIAGNSSEVGLMGDIITALIPYDDDLMVIGMDQSIALMAGDPAAGGSVDIISNDTGIAWAAWALDPDGNLFFMGVDGIYRMPKGEKPISITTDRLEKRFEDIDLSIKRVTLSWDFHRHGLIVIITELDTDLVSDAFFWEARTNGWFPDAYSATHGPDVLLDYDAEEADDKAMLFGCRDGFIRQVDPDAIDDDGIAFTSNVRFFPVGTRRGTDSRLYGLEVILAENSGNVDLNLFTGQTAEQCSTTTEIRWSRTLTAGKNILTLPRLRGAWLAVELKATASTRWALESVFGLFEEGGRSRRLRR